MKAKTAIFSKNTVLDVVKGTLIAAISSLIFVLLLALIVKLTGLSEKAILPINQVIKIISVLIGCMWGIKEKNKGALKGGLIGILFFLLSIAIFLILKVDAVSTFGVIDFFTGLATGIISGVIAVNFAGRRK